MVALVRTLETRGTVKLEAIDPGDTSGVDRKQAQARGKVLQGALSELQETLYAAGHNSVLIVLQGLDTAGKDGTVTHVMSAFNPTGCRVESFKTPTPVELAHDFLWRVHAVTPPLGALTIFNRSYYEDVLVARVHKLVPRSQWEKRFEQINNFETLLTENGTTILKFFLHISKGEQEERLKKRQSDPMKAWKLSTSDWPEHARYDAYQGAYADVLERCSTKHAPWHVVSADHKWFRNLAVADTIVRTLEPRTEQWKKETLRRGRENLAAVRAAAKATR